MALTLTLGGALGGCLERDSARLGPTIGVGQEVSIGGDGITNVDLLFVLDNSRSMDAETERLREQIPLLVENLVAPPDEDGDGEPDWAAVESLHIGVVTSDMGIGFTPERINCTISGDDARLLAPVGAADPVQRWATGEDTGAFVDGLRGVVDEVIHRIREGEGCGFEQQLEAAATVVERREHGFPREDAMLAVVVVSDEDDCSASDPVSFFSDAILGQQNVFCTQPANASRLEGLDSLADRLRGGRGERDFLFAAIVGLPDDAEGASPSELASLPEMQPGEFLLESGSSSTAYTARVCGDLETPYDPTTEGANPGLRYARLGARIPGSLLTSICAADFGPAISELTRRIGSKIGGVCLARALQDRGNGVDCEVLITLPEGERCESYPGYGFVEVSPEGDSLREVCLIEQAVNGEGEGFFYAEPNALCDNGRLELTRTAPAGAELRAECFLAELSLLGEPCARGPQCESGYCGADRLCAEAPRE